MEGGKTFWTTKGEMVTDVEADAGVSGHFLHA